MEKDLEKRIVKYVKSLGLRTAKFIDQSRRGAPDRMIFFSYAKILFLETKVGKNGLSEHQKAYHSILTNEGHRVKAVWTFEDAEKEIDKMVAWIETNYNYLC